jgi:hypothetical protein
MAISFGSNSISNLKLGSTQVLGVYQGSGLVWPSVFPDAINRMQSSSSGYATEFFDAQSDFGYAESTVRQDFRFRKSGNSVIFEVKAGILGSATNDYYLVDNSSGQFTNTTTYEKITEIEIIGGIDKVKLDWSIYSEQEGDATGYGSTTIQGDTSNTGATYAASDGVFRSLNNNESIGFTFECSTYSDTEGEFQYFYVTMQVDVWVGKSGFTDTKIGTFQFKNEVEAYT